MFIAAFAAITVTLFGILWGYVFSVTIGLIVGMIGFYAFKRSQFYFYYNLGLTPWRLFKVSFVINGIISFGLFFMLQLLFIVIRGSL